MLKKVKKKELLRFLIGGSCAVITDYITYRLFLYINIKVGIAKVISFILGSIVGFTINKFWTFESKTLLKSEILKYSVLYLCTAFINSEINKLLLDLFHIESLAFLGATGVSTILNFFGQKFIVFYKGEQK